MYRFPALAAARCRFPVVQMLNEQAGQCALLVEAASSAKAGKCASHPQLVDRPALAGKFRCAPVTPQVAPVARSLWRLELRLAALVEPSESVWVPAAPGQVVLSSCRLAQRPALTVSVAASH